MRLVAGEIAGMESTIIIIMISYQWPSWRTLRSRSSHRDRHRRDPSKTDKRNIDNDNS